MSEQQILSKALDGDIHAFQELFSAFFPQLKSYLYRLLANRNDAEDIAHDTFIRAFDKLHTFKGDASLKTWVFSIATRLAYTYLEKQKRWVPEVAAKAKQLVVNNAALRAEIVALHQQSAQGQYEIREHIDTCFTCIGKHLPIENQVAVILKDIYDFPVADIALVLEKTEGVVKYLLQDGRKVMMDIFDHRCALINKQGVCHQCAELNGWFNPKQDQQQALMQLDLVKGSSKYNREQLYQMRATLVSAIDPLRSAGADLQDILMKCNVLAMEKEK